MRTFYDAVHIASKVSKKASGYLLGLCIAIASLGAFAQAPSLQMDYEAVAASQTTQALGPVGAAGDILVRLIIIPATTSPGAVAIKDGANTAITVFTGGASSVTTLTPIVVDIGARSTAGAWQVTTGAAVSVLAVGRFR
jgi:hypothetical protein